MKASVKFQSNSSKVQSWISIAALIVFALLYCLSALLAPFWNDNDTWSNLLPIIHFRHSILDQHILPLYTNLWYGGRAQWANPLWSFLYLPSTVAWLFTPLDWGARIVFLGHLILSLLAGRKLATLFLETEIENFSAAVILTSPILPALIAGHVEKVMSWAWVLLALFFLFNVKLTAIKRGLGSGICLGVVPLTGANYYTFYAAILLLPLIFSFKNHKLWIFFFLGSSLGLLHLPNVAYMIGHTRVLSIYYIDKFSANLWGVILALSMGFSEPMGWETWAAIGFPMICLLGFIFARKASLLFSGKNLRSPQGVALLISISVLYLFASGIAYYGNDLFDLFRVPARALAFLALGLGLYIFVGLKAIKAEKALKQNTISLFLFASAVQVTALAWLIRPGGSIHSPYEKSVQVLADRLKADQAKSVWLSSSTRDFRQMYIHVGLTRNNLALPNVYYGDIGQMIDPHGDHFGYSFDHLLTFTPVKGPIYELIRDVERTNANGKIPVNNLLLIEEIALGQDVVNIYRVVC